MAVRFGDGASEKVVVAAVGLPPDVKGVAEDRDGADENSDGEVGDHAEQGYVRHTANPCNEGNDEGEEAGENVSEAGDQADDAVKAEADAGAGDDERLVKQDLEEAHVFEVEKACDGQGEGLPAAGWGELDCGRSRWHGVGVSLPGRAANFAQILRSIVMMLHFSSDGTI